MKKPTKAKAKAATPAKKATPARPAHVSAQQRHARHAAAARAAKTRAKNAKKARQHKRVQLALGGAVACCAAEAVAASLRLAGGAVTDADVLALHRAAGGGDETGAAIVAVLEAAGESGLAGIRPVSFAPVDLDDPAAVILGLALPAPHAVAASPEGWWSWGGLLSAADFPDAVIEETWEVTWPAIR